MQEERYFVRDVSTSRSQLSIVEKFCLLTTCSLTVEVQDNKSSRSRAWRRFGELLRPIRCVRALYDR